MYMYVHLVSDVKPWRNWVLKHIKADKVITEVVLFQLQLPSVKPSSENTVLLIQIHVHVVPYLDSKCITGTIWLVKTFNPDLIEGRLINKDIGSKQHNQVLFHGPDQAFQMHYTSNDNRCFFVFCFFVFCFFN